MEATEYKGKLKRRLLIVSVLVSIPTLFSLPASAGDSDELTVRTSPAERRMLAT